MKLQTTTNRTTPKDHPKIPKCDSAPAIKTKREGHAWHRTTLATIGLRELPFRRNKTYDKLPEGTTIYRETCYTGPLL